MVVFVPVKVLEHFPETESRWRTFVHVCRAHLPQMEIHYLRILKCKEDDRADVKNSYVRKVVAAPEPAAVLFLDAQLNDISKFCCNNEYWSPLEVDPTFDLGQFSVMTSQYKNLLVVNRRTGEHPSMMGPLLVHYRKSKSSSTFWLMLW